VRLVAPHVPHHQAVPAGARGPVAATLDEGLVLVDDVRVLVDPGEAQPLAALRVVGDPPPALLEQWSRAMLGPQAPLVP
jgi:hypothetical protein